MIRRQCKRTVCFDREVYRLLSRPPVLHMLSWTAARARDLWKWLGIDFSGNLLKGMGHFRVRDVRPRWGPQPTPGNDKNQQRCHLYCSGLNRASKITRFLPRSSKLTSDAARCLEQGAVNLTAAICPIAHGRFSVRRLWGLWRAGGDTSSPMLERRETVIVPALLCWLSGPPSVSPE